MKKKKNPEVHNEHKVKKCIESSKWKSKRNLKL